MLLRHCGIVSSGVHVGRGDSGVQGQSSWWEVREAHSILWIFVCQNMHNFVYLAIQCMSRW